MLGPAAPWLHFDSQPGLWLLTESCVLPGPTMSQKVERESAQKQGTAQDPMGRQRPGRDLTQSHPGAQDVVVEEEERGEHEWRRCI